MSGPDFTESVPITLARLEGKVDAALATQRAQTEEHARRLDVVDTRLNAHSGRLATVEQTVAKIPEPAPRIGTAQLVGIGLTCLTIFTTVVLTLGGWLVSRL